MTRQSPREEAKLENHSEHECDGTGKCLQSRLESHEPLVSANLPGTSYLPAHPNFELPNSAGYDDLSTPNLINYRLRHAVASCSTANSARRTASTILQDHWEWESDNILNVSASFAEHLEPASPYLRDALSDAFDAALSQLHDLHNERKEWYHHKLPRSLKTACENSTQIDPQADIRSALVVSQDTFDEHVDSSRKSIYESTQTGYRDDDLIIAEPYFETDQYPTAYGFDLPQRFLVTKSSSREHYHLFIPWCGVLRCTCGYARKNPLCKHEIAALVNLVPSPDTDGTTSGLNYRGPDVHPRFERFVKGTEAGDFYKQFTPALKRTHESYALETTTE